MINIGIVGYGYWGPNLVRNFSRRRRAPPLLRSRTSTPRSLRSFSDAIPQ